jgi:hypothetical protein
MKLHSLVARAVLCGAFVLGAGQASAQTYTKQQLQETYSAYLQAEGFRPELTASGNVKFRREGRSYLIIADEDKSAAARLRRLEGCNVASAEVKVIKAYLDSDGDPNFSAEMFLVVPGDFKTSMSLLLRAMDNAYDKYTKKVASMR